MLPYLAATGGPLIIFAAVRSSVTPTLHGPGFDAAWNAAIVIEDDSLPLILEPV